MLENNLTLGMTMGVGLVALSFVLFWALKGLNTCAKSAVMWWLGLRPAPAQSTFQNPNVLGVGKNHFPRHIARSASPDWMRRLGVWHPTSTEPQLNPYGSRGLKTAMMELIYALKECPPEHMANPERFVEVLEEWRKKLDTKEGGGPCCRPKSHEPQM
jgi:hypothetical protein